MGHRGVADEEEEEGEGKKGDGEGGRAKKGIRFLVTVRRFWYAAFAISSDKVFSAFDSSASSSNASMSVYFGHMGTYVVMACGWGYPFRLFWTLRRQIQMIWKSYRLSIAYSPF